VAQESESEDEEQAIYNPLKLPMGWDGKPIPYWLYKLHGLGQVVLSFPSREFLGPLPLFNFCNLSLQSSLFIHLLLFLNSIFNPYP
jgi:hypothetical protein